MENIVESLTIGHEPVDVVLPRISVDQRPVSPQLELATHVPTTGLFGFEPDE